MRRLVLSALLLFVAGAAASAFGQDEGPTLPKTQSKPRASGGSILVVCDLACTWKLDGKGMGSLDAGESKKAGVSLGEHRVDGATADGLDKTGKDIDVKTAAQVMVHIELQPVRDARVQAEQNARDKATREEEVAAQAQQGKALFYQNRYAEAQPLVQKACNGGSMDGCGILGMLYVIGQGVPKDYGQAHTLVQKACDGGSMDGCVGLGVLYTHGLSVAQDYGQARVLFQTACDHENADGCNQLGWLYQNSLGVTQDYGHARMLYKKACDGGNKTACENLQKLP